MATFLDLAATREGRKVSLRGLPILAASATRAGSKVAVERFEVKGSGLDVWAGGDLDAGVKLQGTIDLSAFHDQLTEVLDLGGVGFAGHARLAADYRKVGDHFKGRLIADCKPLDLSGLTAEPIHRDLLRLDASAVGPHALDGLPTGWDSAKLDLKAGDLIAEVEATEGPADPSTGSKPLNLAANLGLDVTSPTPGRFGAKGAPDLGRQDPRHRRPPRRARPERPGGRPGLGGPRGPREARPQGGRAEAGPDRRDRPGRGRARP